MPVLHKYSKRSGYFAKANLRGAMVTYQLSPEGEQFLTGVLNLRDGHDIRQVDFDLLLERGWATTGGSGPGEADFVEPSESKPVHPLGRESGNPTTPRLKVGQPEARLHGGSPKSDDLTQSEPSRVDPARPTNSRRTRAREIALQVLYQTEQNPGTHPDIIRSFIERRLTGDRRLCAFAEALVAGVRGHQPGLDELIAGLAENWRLDRMAAIDRNILRLGAFELLHCPDVPRKVAINEALELAKRYSTAQSSRFVNGILDRLHAEDPAAADEPSSAFLPEDSPASDAGPDA